MEQRILGHVLHVPYTLAKRVSTLWPVMRRLATTATITARPDMQTAARCLQTAIWGANYFIRANISKLEEQDEAQKVCICEASRQWYCYFQLNDSNIPVDG